MPFAWAIVTCPLGTPAMRTNSERSVAAYDDSLAPISFFNSTEIGSSVSEFVNL